jgi:hypothetical protein
VSNARTSRRVSQQTSFSSSRSIRSKSRAVDIVVSPEGLRSSDSASGDVLVSDQIEDIVYTTVADLDRKREFFAYVALDSRLQRAVGHIFETPKGEARKLCLLLSTAHQVCLLIYIQVCNKFLLA